MSFANKKGALVPVALNDAGQVPVALASAAGWAQVSVNRLNNITAYAAGDVVGGVLTFPAMGSAGAHCMITGLDLRLNITTLPAGMAGFKLHLYRGTPPSALADNVAWELAVVDRSVFIGSIDIGTPTDFGSTLFSQLDAVNKQVKLGDGETALYGYLVTTAAYTPADPSEVYTATLRTVTL